MKKKTKKIAAFWLTTIAVAGLSAVAVYGYFAGWLDDQTPAKSSSKNNSKVTASATADRSRDTGTTETAGADSSYVNSRYGYAVDEPAEWTVVQSANGDGITATAPDKTAVIRIYGFNNSTFSLTKTADQMAESERQTHPGVAETSRTEIIIDGHPALEVVWSFAAVGEDAPLTGELRKKVVYSLKDEAGYALEYTAEAGSYEKFAGYFTELASTFKLK
ncbi:MAG: hypothetical protein WC891_01380 [Actinomycetota bacterium]